MKFKENSKILSWAILLALMIIWGSSFILIKKGLTVFSSDEVGALRFVISFIVLLPLAIINLSKIKLQHWKYLVLIGILGNATPFFLFAKAQTEIESSIAGILNSLTPLFTLIVGISFFRLKTKWYNVLGIFIGFTGAAGLIYASGSKSFGLNISYAIYIILATICYALSINIIKKYLRDIDAVTITVFSFFIIGLPIILYLLILTDFPTQLVTDPNALKGLGYISILAIFGTVLALIAFNQLIKMTSVIFAASVTYMIPIVALSWGIIDGEKFEFIYLLWMLIILAGVILVNFNKKIKG